MPLVSQRNSAPCATSSTASSATKPTPMRQYRLLYQLRSDIGEFVSRAPHGKDQSGLGRFVLELLAETLHQGVDAAHGDVRVVAPDALHERFAAEHDSPIARQQVQQIEFVRGEIDIASVDARHATGWVDGHPGNRDARARRRDR